MRRRSVSTAELEYDRAHFLEALREDGVVCLECGILYRFLGRHVRRHGLTLDEYREKWGYNRGRALISPDLRDARRQVALAQNAVERLPGPPESLRNLWEGRGRFTGPRRLEDRLWQSARMRARFAAGARPSNLKVEDKTLRTLVAEGRTSRAIAEHTGLSCRWVRERLRALGLAPPDFVPPEHNRINSALLALRGQGLWISEIAARTGMTISAVAQRLRWLRRRGVAVPRPAGPRPNAKRRVSDEQILGLVHEGLRASEIAARVGITYQGVRYRLGALRQRGVLPPAPSRPTEQPNC